MRLTDPAPRWVGVLCLAVPPLLVLLAPWWVSAIGAGLLLAFLLGAACR